MSKWFESIRIHWGREKALDGCTYELPAGGLKISLFLLLWFSRKIDHLINKSSSGITNKHDKIISGIYWFRLSLLRHRLYHVSTDICFPGYLLPVYFALSRTYSIENVVSIVEWFYRYIIWHFVLINLNKQPHDMLFLGSLIKYMLNRLSHAELSTLSEAFEWSQHLIDFLNLFLSCTCWFHCISFYISFYLFLIL